MCLFPGLVLVLQIPSELATKLIALVVTQLTLLMFPTEIYRVQILPPLTNKLYISPLNPLMLILNPTENLTNMHFSTLTASIKAIVFGV